MQKIYEHRIANGNHVEAISVETNAKSVRIAVSDIEDMDSEDQTEQIISIDLSPEDVMPLVEALLKPMNESFYADMTPITVETLTAKLDALLQRNTKN